MPLITYYVRSEQEVRSTVFDWEAAEKRDWSNLSVKAMVNSAQFYVIAFNWWFKKNHGLLSDLYIYHTLCGAGGGIGGTVDGKVSDILWYVMSFC